MIWSVCFTSHFHGILRNLLKLHGIVETPTRSCSSLDINFELWVPVSLCYTVSWRMKSAQKREDTQEKSVVTSVTWKLPVIWKIKMLLENNYLLWMTRSDEFPDLPVHPKKVAFGCQLGVHPLHTILYTFYCIWTTVLHKVFLIHFQKDVACA